MGRDQRPDRQGIPSAPLPAGAPPVVTVFFAGHGADLAQAARYTGAAGVTVAGHPPARQPAAVAFLHNVYTDAAQPYGVAEASGPVRPWNLGYLGLRLLRWLKNRTRGGPYTWWDVRTDNIGQRSDVAQALNLTRRALATLPTGGKLILFGCSRGASVAVQVAAALTADEMRRVAALVIEGGFDDSVRVMEDRFGHWLAHWVVLSVCERFTEYRRSESNVPLRTALAFPHKRLPILVVSSRVDTVVRARRTHTLYEALVMAAGCTRVTWLSLERAPHSTYATDNAEDTAAYAQALTDLYKTALSV